MRVSIQSFYSSFYGTSFARHFRRIPDIEQSKIPKQFIVKNPKELYLHVHKNSGTHPCFISVYDYGTVDDLKCKDKQNLIFDRVFFDFDVKHVKAEQLKKQLIQLRGKGPHYQKEKQANLKQQLNNLIIDEEIAKSAIDDAKTFSIIFKRDFGEEPALFFSGFKGCHAYVFFEPFEPKEPNKTVHYFAKNVKNSYNFSTLDLSVNKDAISRISRIPYSKHQLTNLTVVPFKIKDSYNEIVRSSLLPKVQPFNVDENLTNLNIHLEKIDDILHHNTKIKPKQKNNSRINTFKFSSYNKPSDHRVFFKQIIGKPAKEYENYNMYHCPFPDHEDLKPSFMVHSKGYKCLGCSKKGNYWQFLKEYCNWDNNEVKKFLLGKP